MKNPKTELIMEALKHYGVTDLATRERNHPTVVGWLKRIFPWAQEDDGGTRRFICALNPGDLNWYWMIM